nr:MAG TPA: hypothetical protein [Caudoviricetes sp.]
MIVSPEFVIKAHGFFYVLYEQLLNTTRKVA